MAMSSSSIDNNVSASPDRSQPCGMLCGICNVAQWIGAPRSPAPTVYQKSNDGVVYLELRNEDNRPPPEVRLSPDCPICEMIGSLIPSNHAMGSIKISLGLLANTIRPWYHIQNYSLRYDVLNILVESELEGEPPLVDVRFGMSPNLGRNTGLRRIQPDKIDWTLMVDWLRHCEAEHSDGCVPEQPVRIPGFTVIDCLTTELVQDPPDDCIYLALSYVWGKAKSHCSDDVRFSRTIKDSMTVVLKLGFRYLWVDRLVSYADTTFGTSQLTFTVYRSDFFK